MYTFAPTSQERRSAQTVLWQITEALVRLVAPILSFTADEVWEYLPDVEGREASVHLAQFPKPEEVFSEDPAKLLEEWKQILCSSRRSAARTRRSSSRQNASARALKRSLKSLPTVSSWLFCKRHAAGLKEIVNVSEVTVIDRSIEGDANVHGRSVARHRPQMRPLLELHARSLQLRHLGKRLHPLPVLRSKKWASTRRHRLTLRSRIGYGIMHKSGRRCWKYSRSETGIHFQGSANEIHRTSPPALAAAHLRRHRLARPPHQDLGRRAHSASAAPSQSSRTFCASLIGPTTARPFRSSPTPPRRTLSAGR